MKNATALLLGASLTFSHSPDEWMMVYPAQRWSRVIVPSIDIDINDAPSDVLPGLEVCFQGEGTQCVPVLTLTHSWARGETQSVYMAKPEAGNGIARFSMWLRHRELLPSTVMSNRTVYAWNDNFAAAAELRRRIEWCSSPTTTTTTSCCCDFQTLRGHLAVAEARHEREVRDRRDAAAPSGGRSVQRLGVVSTIYNGVRRHTAKNRSEEGLWARNLSLVDPEHTNITIFNATEVTERHIPLSLLAAGEGNINIEVLPLANPMRAQECPGVLSFIIDNYASLPDGMIFIHGYPFDHNEQLVDLLPRLLRLNRERGLPSFDYVNLNDVWESPRCQPLHRRAEEEQEEATFSELLGLNDEFAGSEPAGAATECFSSRYCCGQFLVSRDAVLSRPRSFYRLALKLSLDRRECK